MTPESALLRSVLLACSNGSTRLFRNNVGMLPLPEGGMLRYGLAVGSSDLIGWTTINGVAVFSALEVKVRAPLTLEQKRFIDAVNRAGGRAGCVHSIDEAKAVIG